MKRLPSAASVGSIIAANSVPLPQVHATCWRALSHSALLAAKRPKSSIKTFADAQQQQPHVATPADPPPLGRSNGGASTTDTITGSNSNDGAAITADAIHSFIRSLLLASSSSAGSGMVLPQLASALPDEMAESEVLEERGLRAFLAASPEFYTLREELVNGGGGKRIVVSLFSEASSAPSPATSSSSSPTVPAARVVGRRVKGPSTAPMAAHTNEESAPTCTAADQSLGWSSVAQPTAAAPTTSPSPYQAARAKPLSFVPPPPKRDGAPTDVTTPTPIDSECSARDELSAANSSATATTTVPLRTHHGHGRFGTHRTPEEKKLHDALSREQILSSAPAASSADLPADVRARLVFDTATDRYMYLKGDNFLCDGGCGSAELRSTDRGGYTLQTAVRASNNRFRRAGLTVSAFQSHLNAAASMMLDKSHRVDEVVRLLPAEVLGEPRLTRLVANDVGAKLIANVRQLRRPPSSPSSSSSSSPSASSAQHPHQRLVDVLRDIMAANAIIPNLVTVVGVEKRWRERLRSPPSSNTDTEGGAAEVLSHAQIFDYIAASDTEEFAVYAGDVAPTLANFTFYARVNPTLCGYFSRNYAYPAKTSIFGEKSSASGDHHQQQQQQHRHNYPRPDKQQKYHSAADGVNALLALRRPEEHHLYRIARFVDGRAPTPLLQVLQSAAKAGIIDAQSFERDCVGGDDEEGKAHLSTQNCRNGISSDADGHHTFEHPDFMQIILSAPYLFEVTGPSVSPYPYSSHNPRDLLHAAEEGAGGMSGRGRTSPPHAQTSSVERVFASGVEDVSVTSALQNITNASAHSSSRVLLLRATPIRDVRFQALDRYLPDEACLSLEQINKGIAQSEEGVEVSRREQKERMEAKGKKIRSKKMPFDKKLLRFRAGLKKLKFAKAVAEGGKSQFCDPNVTAWLVYDFCLQHLRQKELKSMQQREIEASMGDSVGDGADVSSSSSSVYSELSRGSQHSASRQLLAPARNNNKNAAATNTTEDAGEIALPPTVQPRHCFHSPEPINFSTTILPLLPSVIVKHSLINIKFFHSASGLFEAESDVMDVVLRLRDGFSNTSFHRAECAYAVKNNSKQQQSVEEARKSLTGMNGNNSPSRVVENVLLSPSDSTAADEAIFAGVFGANRSETFIGGGHSISSSAGNRALPSTAATSVGTTVEVASSMPPPVDPSSTPSFSSGSTPSAVHASSAFDPLLAASHVICRDGNVTVVGKLTAKPGVRLLLFSPAPSQSSSSASAAAGDGVAEEAAEGPALTSSSAPAATPLTTPQPLFDDATAQTLNDRVKTAVAAGRVAGHHDNGTDAVIGGGEAAEGTAPPPPPPLSGFPKRLAREVYSLLYVMSSVRGGASSATPPTPSPSPSSSLAFVSIAMLALRVRICDRFYRPSANLNSQLLPEIPVEAVWRVHGVDASGNALPTSLSAVGGGPQTNTSTSGTSGGVKYNSSIPLPSLEEQISREGYNVLTLLRACPDLFEWSDDGTRVRPKC